MAYWRAWGTIVREMNVIGKLAGQTAVYGLSSVVPRLLNYFLVALHSRVFVEAEYGVITELYAYIAILLILLTFGLETGFFRFASVTDRAAGERTYGSVFWFLTATSATFFLVCWGALTPISSWLGYREHPEYILLLAGILSVDAWSAIIFDKLRWLQRPYAFSGIKIAGVAINVGLNVLFLVGFPAWGLYSASFGPGYVLLSNLIASAFGALAALIATGGFPRHADRKVLRPIMAFSLPLLIGGLGGTTNEFLDRIFIKWLTPASDPLAELGIYGANVKIAVLVVLCVQMFKYAAEPFFFAQAQQRSDPKIYANVTKYFTYCILVVVVGITFYLPVLQYFVGTRFRVALDVIPILLVANLLYGFYFNVSFWYKIQKRTWYGVLFAFIGAAITVCVNLLLTPTISYYGAALARVASYLAMCILCVWIGQRYFPVPYDFRRILLATGISATLCIGGMLIHIDSKIALLAIRSAIILLQVGVILKLENLSFGKLIGAWRKR